MLRATRNLLAPGPPDPIPTHLTGAGDQERRALAQPRLLHRRPDDCVHGHYELAKHAGKSGWGVVVVCGAWNGFYLWIQDTLVCAWEPRPHARSILYIPPLSNHHVSRPTPHRASCSASLARGRIARPAPAATATALETDSAPAILRPERAPRLFVVIVLELNGPTRARTVACVF